MFEHGLLILGIGLVVFNGMKVLMVLASKFSESMARNDAELIAVRNDNDKKNKD